MLKIGWVFLLTNNNWTKSFKNKHFGIILSGKDCKFILHVISFNQDIKIIFWGCEIRLYFHLSNQTAINNKILTRVVVKNYNSEEL